jgi:ABC-type branched-subunit amino acid transport system ATPase component
MSLLSINNLTAGYGDLHVLEDVHLDVVPGEMVVLIGPNGAGKSTVLKSVFGLTTKTGGTIKFRDKDITKLPTHSLIEEGIGFVPQGRLVFPTLTVKENLEIGGYLIDHKETMQENLENVYETFPALRQKCRVQAGTLSGGQQQQLAIGRSLMMSPELLMLDEPSLGLSPILMHEVFETLEALRQSGMTILVVEQNVRLALQYVDRGYLLAAGQIRFCGTAKELGNEDLMRDAYLA